GVEVPDPAGEVPGGNLCQFGPEPFRHFAAYVDLKVCEVHVPIGGSSAELRQDLGLYRFVAVRVAVCSPAAKGPARNLVAVRRQHPRGPVAIPGTLGKRQEAPLDLLLAVVPSQGSHLRPRFLRSIEDGRVSCERFGKDGKTSGHAASAASSATSSAARS